jgi:hypothetical protein
VFAREVDGCATSRHVVNTDVVPTVGAAMRPGRVRRLGPPRGSRGLSIRLRAVPDVRGTRSAHLWGGPVGARLHGGGVGTCLAARGYTLLNELEAVGGNSSTGECPLGPSRSSEGGEEHV